MENKDKTHAKAVNLVLKCGIPPHLSGCDYLATAIELTATQKQKMPEIYKMLAAENDVKPGSIMRDVTYAINSGYDVREKVSEITGFQIPKHEMHASLVISCLAVEFKSMLDE